MLPHYSLNKYSNLVVIGCGGKIQHSYTSSYSGSPNVSTTTYGQLSPSVLPKVQVSRISKKWPEIFYASEGLSDTF